MNNKKKTSIEIEIGLKDNNFIRPILHLVLTIASLITCIWSPTVAFWIMTMASLTATIKVSQVKK